MIEKLLEDPSLTNRLLELTNIKASSLESFIHTNKETLNLSTILRIIEELFPSLQHELMNEYILSLNPNKKLARFCLEYLNTTRQDDVLDQHLKILLNSKSSINREWATIYLLDRKQTTREFSNSEVISLLHNTRVHTLEMKLYSKMIAAYCHFEDHLLQEIYDAIHPLEPKLKKIKDPYIKESYTARFGLIMTPISLHFEHQNDLLRYSQMVFKCSGQKALKCMTHIQLGNSYLISHYDNALFHFKKALELSDHIREVQIKRSLNFLDNYWGKQPKHLNHESSAPKDIHEIAFFHIQQGEPLKAIAMLQTIKWEILSKSEKAFHLYFKGLALNDRNCLIESVRYFKEGDMMHYKNIPLIALRNMGEDETIIEALK
ncbi:AimR family lysis-lysogeny pheromone receptor [Litchfieldia alkalitelluris]|uniref:AimR family lysis-lysogeny pheromone receptor n=1 Tax=Litchfieldia alkalitelluris TaxID=304268 RepID=UPI00195B501A|nr:AimR family lysis-lysogeny pheromone receptor [Litchfieldia alkalitelluris]